MRLFRWYEVVLDLFFPRRCVACNSFGRWVCDSCAQTVIKQLWFEPVEKDIFGLYLLDEPIVREMVHALKYGAIRELGDIFVDILNASCHPDDFCLAAGLSGQVVIVPVPLGKKRLARRGYNQADLLAKALAQWLNYPVVTGLLARRAGRTVVGQGRAARQRQAMQQFYVSGEVSLCREAQYLIVDDVITSGNTLKICRQLLLEHGAVEVKAVGFARKLA